MFASCFINNLVLISIYFLISNRWFHFPTLFPYTTLFRSPSSSGVLGPRLLRTRRPARRPARGVHAQAVGQVGAFEEDRKSTRLNSSHLVISYAVFCLKKKKTYKCKNHITHIKRSNQRI